MVHISDVCRVYLCAYELLINNKEIRNRIYGVCTENRITLKELIKLFGKVLGETINVNMGGKPYKSREIMNPCQYEKLPNWNTKISIDQGLKKIK